MCASGSRISTSASVSMSRALTSPRLVDPQVERLGGVDVHLQRNLLQVQDDVGRVLDHAGDRRELVQHAVDLDRRDRRAFNRRQQHAPQGVADGRAEPALERLRVEPSEPIRERLALELQPLGPLKTFPEHVSSYLSIRRPDVSARQTCRVAPRLPPQVWEGCGRGAALAAASFQFPAASKQELFLKLGAGSWKLAAISNTTRRSAAPARAG